MTSRKNVDPLSTNILCQMQVKCIYILYDTNFLTNVDEGENCCLTQSLI